MGKKVYRDSDKIQDEIGKAFEFGITRTEDLRFYLKNSTGYDLERGAIEYHVKEYQKSQDKDLNWLEVFTKIKSLKTAKTHLDILEKIRTDLLMLLDVKMRAYKEAIMNGDEADPMLLQEIMEINNALGQNLDHIEKRNMALMYIYPMKITIDEAEKKVKLDNSDPNTKNAILLEEYQAEVVEDEQKQLIDLTEAYGEGNEIA